MKLVKWFKDAVVYHILVDRFAGYDEDAEWQKPVFAGGNIRAVTDKLPYLVDLGINTIWLSPVNTTSAYHGYHITDFFSIDKRFGTLHDLRDLIESAHNRNVRVMLDFVPNHCSSKHPFFLQASSDKNSKYRKWFYFSRFNDKYICFLDFPELPKINLDNNEAREHLVESARYWQSMGIDGFRLDHAIGPSHAFWKLFSNTLKSINPEFILIGEAWLDGVTRRMLKTIRIRRKYTRWLLKFDPWDIQSEYTGEFDGVLDFYFRHRITEYIAWKENPMEFDQHVKSVMKRHYEHFPKHYYLPSFIENHDMNRFLYDAGQDRQKLKQALDLQFSLPQPPILYYGTETGLTHQLPVKHDIHYSDLQARSLMPWNLLDHELIDYCRKLIRQWKGRKRML